MKKNKYFNSAKRVPELEVMEGEVESKHFFKAHRERHEFKNDSYFFVVKHLFDNVPLRKGVILDVGCGYGGLIKCINDYNKNFSFIGVEFSKSMIKIGEKYLKGLNASFLRVNAENTSLSSNSVDLVVCKDTFHNFKNPKIILREMYRITKNNGYIYITDLKARR